MEAPIDVWNEVRTTPEGISITLYSQKAGEQPVVEDELWLTEAELSESPSEISFLHLSSESKSALRESESDDSSHAFPESCLE